MPSNPLFRSKQYMIMSFSLVFVVFPAFGLICLFVCLFVLLGVVHLNRFGGGGNLPSASVKLILNQGLTVVLYC